MGRPFNDSKFAKFVAALEEKPRTVKELANRLKIGERTVYDWLERAREGGRNLARLGWNPTKWRIYP